MKKHSTLLGMILLCINICVDGISQETTEPNVTISAQNQKIGTILDQIGRKYNLNFYYKAADLPTQGFTINAENQPLSEVLTALFSTTSFGYLNYSDYAYVIMPQRMIGELYTSSFYEALETSIADDDDNRSKELVIGDIRELGAAGTATITGTITDGDDNEPIIGATILWKEAEIGEITDANGQFTVELPAGTHQLEIKYLGYTDLIKIVKVFSDGELDIELIKNAIQLQEVTVSAQAADENVRNAQVGIEQLDLQEVKKLPSFMGEADVVRNLLLNPGVSSVGEGASGFNVRGGSVDQNLVLQDETILFNSSHALGFFSTFNPDLLQKVDLYKGNIPSNYGGRLASVMDVDMKEGDMEDFKLKAGISPITSKLSMEGPIVKDKISFAIGGRASYSDWILDAINVVEVQRSTADFYDVNAKFTFKLHEKHTLNLGGYYSFDEFTFNREFGFDYATTAAYLNLRSAFSDKVLSNLTVAASTYESTQFDFNNLTASQLENDIQYLKAKEELIISPTPNLDITAGLEAILYEVAPGTISPLGDSSLVISKSLENEKGLESGAFVNLDYSLSSRLRLSAGARFSIYQFLGPNTQFIYSDPENPTVPSQEGSQFFDKNDVIETYSNIEPRLSLRYRINANSSVKLGYSRTVQYINQIFNTDTPTPTSQWQLSTEIIKPNRSHNYSVGVFKNIKDNEWETSISGYYRDIDQLFDYRDFAELTVNEHIETELLQGIGRTYGLEVSLVKNNLGPVYGRLSYTLSRAERQIAGINDGEWYPSNFDKTHDLSFVLNYQPNRRNTLTFNFTFATGRPTTPPTGNFRTDSGLIIPIFSDRNQFRIPDYHRLDVAYTLGKGYRKNQKVQTSWTISVYNLYARRNAFSVFYRNAAFQQYEAFQLAVLGSIFPSVTLNLEIL